MGREIFHNNKPIDQANQSWQKKKCTMYFKYDQ
jgi:hypothetical protein